MLDIIGTRGQVFFNDYEMIEFTELSQLTLF